jgi:hypothetical protein
VGGEAQGRDEAVLDGNPEARGGGTCGHKREWSGSES